ncbi:spore coat protein [Oscillospiraceae bacterium MB08-C2-2]|nr:spore coat protein [Oscillospiraceae bacterium MB08-C2-2]
MPNLTSKELTAIEDQLGIEQNLIKKYTMYAQATQDSQLKTKCDEIAAKHQCHYNTLLSHLN